MRNKSRMLFHLIFSSSLLACSIGRWNKNQALQSWLFKQNQWIFRDSFAIQPDMSNCHVLCEKSGVSSEWQSCLPCNLIQLHWNTRLGINKVLEIVCMLWFLFLRQQTPHPPTPAGWKVLSAENPGIRGVHSFKPWVGQNTALNALPAARLLAKKNNNKKTNWTKQFLLCPRSWDNHCKSPDELFTQFATYV